MTINFQLRCSNLAKNTSPEFCIESDFLFKYQHKRSISNVKTFYAHSVVSLTRFCVLMYVKFFLYNEVYGLALDKAFGGS